MDRFIPERNQRRSILQIPVIEPPLDEMVKQDPQAVSGRQVVIRHPVQADGFEGAIDGHEEGVSGARDVWSEIGEVQETGDVCEAPIPLECQEGVRQELGSKPGESQQGRRLLVPMLLVESGDDGLAHEQHLAYEHYVAVRNRCVALYYRRTVH